MIDVIDKPAMMVGHSALLGYAREVGRAVPEIYDPQLPPVLEELSGGSLARLAERLRDLLGSEYERLALVNARSKRARTPPASRNRLVELIEFAEDASERLEPLDQNTRVSLDGNFLAEAISFLAMASRWGSHPAWPGLKATLTTDEAAHTVMLLLVAAYLADANNGVGIHVGPSKQGVSTADIWIEPDLSQRVDLEVKAPLRLWDPRQPISQEHAVKILERALKKSRRQRRNTMSSLLVVGGYHLRDSFDTIVSTARANVLT